MSTFLDYYNKIWKRTLRVVDSIPQKRIAWKPIEEAFTFQDILIHLVNMERYMFVETVINNKNRYPGHIQTEIETYDVLIKYITSTHNDSIELLSKLNDTDLECRCNTPDDASISVWKWLRAMIEHHVHHRGQIYTYLKLIKTKSPPLYGLTSEQVKKKGVS
ncbi:MAG: DinB family protein [Candidatus Kariarchaeaceae archaeon]